MIYKYDIKKGDIHFFEASDTMGKHTYAPIWTDNPQRLGGTHHKFEHERARGELTRRHRGRQADKIKFLIRKNMARKKAGRRVFL